MTTTSTTDKRATILLVEDEPMISMMVAEVLTEQGFAVETVSNAEEALFLLMQGRPFDILFTDVNLPGKMDGAELARRARAINPLLPVMYTSGRRSIIESMAPVDGSMFVPKPYSPYEIGRLIEYLIAMNAQPGIRSPRSWQETLPASEYGSPRR